MSMQVAETQGPVLREGARDDCAKQDNRNHVGAWVPALWFPTFGLLFSFFHGYPTLPPFSKISGITVLAGNSPHSGWSKGLRY
jgi:hypothetical protein